MSPAESVNDCRPQHWCDDLKHPTFRIGSSSFPASILPLTICAAFLVSKAYLIYTVNQGRPTSYANGHLSPMKEKAFAPDAENQRETSQVQPFTPFHRVLLQNVLRFHNQAWISVGLFDTTFSYKASLTPFCLLQVVNLLLAGTVLDREKLRPCLFAAVGWLAHLLQQDYAHGSMIASIGTIALALPCAWMLGEDGDKYRSSYSGIFLLTLASDPHIATESALRSPKLMNNEVWPLGVLLAIAFAKHTFRLGRRTGGHNENVAQRVRVFVGEVLVVQMPELARTLFKVAAFLFPMASFFCVTGLCCASLGWKWVLLGLPATPPSGTLGAYLGGMLFIIAWCVGSAVQGRDRRERSSVLVLVVGEVRFCAEAAGWSITVLICFWLVLASLPRSSKRGLVCL